MILSDRIVCGIFNKRTKNRLSLEERLTLEMATGICRAAEQTEKHLKEH